MSVSGLPFDDFRALLRDLPGPDARALVAARERDAQLTKPPGALGRLEEIAFWLAAWTGRSPAVTRPLVAIFAGNHGVTKQGITPFPPSVTQQMVENFAAGGAAINQICVAYDLGLKVFDLALDFPTADITEEPALSERDCAATMAFGMEAIAGGTDLLCIGEMGIGNTTIAAAIHYALYGGKAEDWVGPGTGSEGEMLKRKIAAVEKAVALHRDHLSDPLEILLRLGGREIAAMEMVIWCAKARFDLGAERVALQGAAVVPALLMHGGRPYAVFVHRWPQPQAIEQARRVGTDLDARADLTEARRLLVDLNVEPRLQQTKCGRQAADPAPDNSNLHPSTPRHTASPSSQASPRQAIWVSGRTSTSRA